jgi:hypothetical protein
MESNRKPSGKAEQSQQQKVTPPAQPPARSGTSRADGGLAGAGQDAAPSNTASHKCNREYFQPLRWGIDSLYLTYPGEVFEEVDTRLKTLKKIAQSPEAHEQAQAQYLVGKHIFEVKDKAPKGFAYVLEDGAFRIQISRSSKLPVAYVKISSGYLAHVGPAKAEEEARIIVNELIDVRELPNVSRIDLYVDFVTPENMEWSREAWITRASSIDSYSEGGTFTGWVVGKGGIISARLYYKLLQATKIGANYLLDLWRQAGWNGEGKVWRLEFQLRRELLSQHGLPKLAAVLDNLNGLWSYATTEWLRLTLPSADDKTRSRWPIHPLWGYLSSIDWETDGGPLTRSYSPARVPGDDYLFAHGLSLLISYMAREKIGDLYAGQDDFMAALYNYHSERANRLGLTFDSYIAEKVAIKGRQFNTILNDPGQADDLDAADLEQRAWGYRKGSKGGA